MNHATFFQNKVVWITGASSGIGAELAKQLARHGAQLILSARDEQKLIALADTLENHARHLVLPLDLAKLTDTQIYTDQILAKFGRIDILINNGGVSQRASALETTMEVNRQLMEVNFFGNIALAKAVLPIFRKQANGQFLVVSSIAGKFGFHLRSIYSASKAALVGYYESVAMEEAENGIEVSIAFPGKINTPISQHALTAVGDAHGQVDNNQATGMPVEHCVELMLEGLAKRKREILIGGKELLAVYLKRFVPRLFWKIIPKQSAT
ncbi:MAG: SDR family oxidoreductase [Flavobacteriales bacterium]